MNRNTLISHLLAMGLALTGLSCKSGAPEPSSRKGQKETAKPSAPATTRTTATATPRPTSTATARPIPPTGATPAKPVAEVPVSPGDPVEGKFSIEDATKGLAGTGKLIATLKTTKGALECELFEDKAPISVATFVGLARGLRPWKTPSGEWVKKPLYDGTPFHRVIRGFMIQGGDPKGTGAGGPGFVIPDEIWEGAKHDERGLLCMANRGKNTNGSQFFILDGKAPHLDGGYTIFGKCSPETVIDAIATTPVRGDRAIEPVKIEKLTVKRK